MLRILYILILLPFVGFSQLKTDSQLTNDLNNLVPNNTSQLIKPVHIRTVIQNGYDSRVSMYGETGILGKLTYATLFPFTDPKDLVNKKYVDDAVVGFSGGVTSFNTRTGAIVPLSTDYSAYYYPASGNPSGFLTTIPTLTAADIPNLDASKITTGTFADARISSAATWNAKQNAIGLTTTGTTGAATLIGSTLNIPQYAGGVTSVFSRTGVVVAQSGDYNTSQVTENTNLYFTNARAQAAISVTPPLTYAGGVLGIQLATASQGGALSNTNQDIAGVKDFKAGVQLTGGIKDANYNQMLSVGASFSAVNSLYINNAATGASPSLGVQGSDANIGLSLLPQGTGVLYIGGSGGLKVNTLAGTDFRALEADALGNVTATRRPYRTLATEVGSVTYSAINSSVSYATFIVPASYMSKDGDAVNYEFTGDCSGSSTKGIRIVFSGSASTLSECTSASAFNASRTIKIIRTSNTTAAYHVIYSGVESITTYTPITGINWTTTDYNMETQLFSTGSGGSCTARTVRLTFEPAP